MRHQSTPCGTAQEWPQVREALDLRYLLEVTKGRRGLGPAVETKDWPIQFGREFQQRLIQRHVERGLACAGIEQPPILCSPCFGHTAEIVSSRLFGTPMRGH